MLRSSRYIIPALNLQPLLSRNDMNANMPKHETANGKTRDACSDAADDEENMMRRYARRNVDGYICTAC